MTFIYSLPSWAFISAATIGSCVLVSLLLPLMRTRLSRNEQISHNDVAGPILTTIGTVLAVMMSFMVIDVWQEYDGAAQNVQMEASAVSDLHHLADGFPSGVRVRLKDKLDTYVRDVLTIEWPEMKHGGESREAHNLAYDVLAIITAFRPVNGADATIQSTALSTTMKFLDARRQRIHDNRQGIPIVLWAIMLVIGAITVLFAFYFRVDRPKAQVVMLVALTIVISLTFTLIAELDYPFRGDVSISPSAFEHVYATMHNIGLEP